MLKNSTNLMELTFNILSAVVIYYSFYELYLQRFIG